MGVIYGLCDPDTGEVRYVGKTVGDPKFRLKCHLADRGRSRKANWIRSLPGPPTIRVLEDDPADLDEAERRWIAELPNLTNLTAGGDGGDTSASFTEEGRRVMSATHLGVPKTEEHRQKLSAAAKQRAKSSWPTPWNKGRTGVYTDEVRDRFSRAQRTRMARESPPRISGKFATR
jgi:hypothetical protein